MPAQFTKRFVQDLTQDIKIRQCGTIVFNADNESNVISVDLYNGTEEYSGGGTVAGACICPDGSTVALTGSISGKTASVVLTGDCFAFPGQIGIGVQVVSGTVKTTVLKAIYNVELFETDDMVDPGSRITASVGQLVADIEAATAEIPASDMASLMSGIAPTFSDSTAYPAGAYAYYNGTLYKFTSAHAAGSWTGTDATQVDLGNDLGSHVSNLKNAVFAETTPTTTWEQGSYSSSGQKNQSTSTVYIRTDSIVPMLDGGYISAQSGYLFRTHFYKADGTFIERDSGWTSERNIPKGSYITLVAEKDGTQAISPSDAGNIIIKEVGVTFAPKIDEVYISTTGNDSTGNGTASSPYATFAKALSTGLHTIKVAVGTYNEVVTITGRDNLKIVPYPRPVYDSGSAMPKPQIKKLEINNSRFVEIEDILIDSTDNDSACAQIYNNYSVKMTNCEAKNGAKGGFVVYDSNVEFYNCIAHDVGSEKTPVSDGFNFHNYGSSVMNGCIAYNCTDDGASHHEQTIGVIENCLFYNCGSDIRGSGIAPVHNSTIRISNCIIHDCHSGLECADSTNPAYVVGTVLYDNDVDIYCSSPVIIYNTKYGTTNHSENITDLSADN